MKKESPDKKVKVHFDPDNVDIVVGDGAILLQGAIAA